MRLSCISSTSDFPFHFDRIFDVAQSKADIPNDSFNAVILWSYGIQIYILSRFDFLLDPFGTFFYTCFVLIIVLKDTF